MINKKTKDEITNGAIAGCFSVFIFQPFQVIRTSMMVTYDHGRTASMYFISKKIYKEEGSKGFYRGFSPAMIKTTIGTAIYFGILEFLKRSLNQYTNSHSANFLSSGIARLIQSILINPISVIKTRFEVVGFNSYSSMFEAVQKIKKEEGYRGFFKGLKPGLIKDVPASGIFYSMYEFFKMKVNHWGIRGIQYQAALSSFLTTIILIVVTNPLDVLRTRLLYLHFSKNKNHEYKGIITGVCQIAKQEGIHGLLSGIAPKFVKKSAAGIAVWTSYETLKEGIKKE
jgi:hypothetical protein